MNRTLVIYDTEGYIISQMGGDVREPKGVPFMWVDMPQGKYLKYIDVTQEQHEPVYEDYPKSEIDTLRDTVDMLVLSLLEV